MTPVKAYRGRRRGWKVGNPPCPTIVKFPTKPQKLKRKDELRLQDERENVRSERTRPLLSRQERNLGRFN